MVNFMMIAMALVAAQVLAEVDQEDSSEYGSAPGKKSTTCPCGWRNEPKARILHGKETAPNEFPWMVALRSYFSNTYAKCGGAIVTRRHVITAAHCLVDMYGDLTPFAPDKVHVYAGIHNIDNNTPKETFREYRAERTFVRPEFPKNLTHDFAVIVLKEDIQFSQFVGPICLSPKNIAKADEVLTIMGWGTTDVLEYSSVLMKAKTTVLYNYHCFGEIWEICTKTKPSSTCGGDSGGPLVWLDPDTNRYTQVSLVSYGAPDCVSGPTVSTNVAYFYDYLQQIIKDTHPEVQTCIKKE
uniref:Putative transmembrane protease serine 12 n=1 Tax=Panstrongylus lignarius TaxID=156445 RepID=A0A224XUQ4_9HEMI